METQSVYIKKIYKYLINDGFKDDRSWKSPQEHGAMFYSLSKNVYRWEIYFNWDKLYSHYSSLELRFLDCRNEMYSDGSSGYIGYMGQSTLHIFKKQITKNLMKELHKHYLNP